MSARPPPPLRPPTEDQQPGKSKKIAIKADKAQKEGKKSKNAVSTTVASQSPIQPTSQEPTAQLLAATQHTSQAPVEPPKPSKYNLEGWIRCAKHSSMSNADRFCPATEFDSDAKSCRSGRAYGRNAHQAQKAARAAKVANQQQDAAQSQAPAGRPGNSPTQYRGWRLCAGHTNRSEGQVSRYCPSNEFDKYKRSCRTTIEFQQVKTEKAAVEVPASKPSRDKLSGFKKCDRHSRRSGGTNRYCPETNFDEGRTSCRDALQHHSDLARKSRHRERTLGKEIAQPLPPKFRTVRISKGQTYPTGASARLPASRWVRTQKPSSTDDNPTISPWNVYYRHIRSRNPENRRAQILQLMRGLTTPTYRALCRILKDMQEAEQEDDEPYSAASEDTASEESATRDAVAEESSEHHGDPSPTAPPEPECFDCRKCNHCRHKSRRFSPKDQDNYCIYCHLQNRRTAPQNLITEQKYCKSGQHEVSRSRFYYDANNSIDPSCLANESVVCLECAIHDDVDNENDVAAANESLHGRLVDDHFNLLRFLGIHDESTATQDQVRLLKDLSHWKESNDGRQRYRNVRGAVYYPETFIDEDGEEQFTDVQLEQTNPQGRLRSIKATWQTERTSLIESRMMAASQITGLYGVDPRTAFRQTGVEPDGNCLWRAAAAIIFEDEGWWREVREMVRAHWRAATGLTNGAVDLRLQQDRGQFYDTLNQQTIDSAHPEGSPGYRRHARLEHQILAGDQYWGSEELWQVIADAFDTEIIIHSPNFPVDYTTDDSTNSGTNLNGDFVHPTTSWTIMVRGEPIIPGSNRHQRHVINYQNTGHWQVLHPEPDYRPEEAGPGRRESFALPLQVRSLYTAHMQHPNSASIRDPLHLGSATPPIRPESRIPLLELARRTNPQTTTPVAAQSEDDNEAEDNDVPQQRIEIPTGILRVIARESFKKLPPKDRAYALANPYQYFGAISGLEAAEPADYILYGSEKNGFVISMSDSGPRESAMGRDERLVVENLRRGTDPESGLIYTTVFTPNEVFAPKDRTKVDDDTTPRSLSLREGTETVSSEKLTEWQKAHNSPVVLNFGRYSSPRSANDVVQALQSHTVVLQDYFFVRAIHRFLNIGQAVPFVPYPHAVHDFWINGVSATDAVPTYDSHTVIPDHSRFIQVMGLINQQGQHAPIALWIMRSTTGLSVAWGNWANFRARWPYVRIHVVFALRRPFVAYMNQLNNVQGLQVELLLGPGVKPSPRNMHYTVEVDARDLETCDNNPQNIGLTNPPIAMALWTAMKRARDWRSNTLPLAQATLVRAEESDRNGYV